MFLLLNNKLGQNFQQPIIEKSRLEKVTANTTILTNHNKQ